MAFVRLPESNVLESIGRVEDYHRGKVSKKRARRERVGISQMFIKVVGRGVATHDSCVSQLSQAHSIKSTLP